MEVYLHESHKIWSQYREKFASTFGNETGASALIVDGEVVNLDLTTSEEQEQQDAFPFFSRIDEGLSYYTMTPIEAFERMISMFPPMLLPFSEYDRKVFTLEFRHTFRGTKRGFILTLFDHEDNVVIQSTQALIWSKIT